MRRTLLSLGTVIGATILATGCGVNVGNGSSDDAAAKTTPTAEATNAGTPGTADTPPATDAPGDTDAPRAGSGGTVELDGLGVSRTVACEGKDYQISGAKLQITFTGACGAIQVTGGDNTIIADQKSNSADILQIDGYNNKVRIYKVETVEINGAQNTVTYTVGDPDINDVGAGNSVNQA